MYYISIQPKEQSCQLQLHRIFVLSDRFIDIRFVFLKEALLLIPDRKTKFCDLKRYFDVGTSRLAFASSARILPPARCFRANRRNSQQR